MTRDLGIYVHVPWCRSVCPYCDFPVAVARDGDMPHEAYLEAILAELEERAPEAAGRRLVSIYFGGGTPSLWRSECLAAVVARVVELLGEGRAAGDLEITLEANPADCTPGNMAAWRDAGVNRLSIGVQSVAQRELSTLGRDHRMGDGTAALAAALEATRQGTLARVSADVIFGVPGSDQPAVASAVALAGTGVGHLSVYELTIEERTAFGRAARTGKLVPVDEDDLARAYVAIHDALSARGFEHYEISSYARPGQRAVHNQLYWHGGEYLGLGNGAASFRALPGGGGERRTNHRSVKRYLGARGEARVAEREALSADEVTRDRLWLGMRTSDGVPASALADMPGAVEELAGAGLVRLVGDRICPTLRGFLYSDRIASRLYGERR